MSVSCTKNGVKSASIVTPAAVVFGIVSVTFSALDTLPTVSVKSNDTTGAVDVATTAVCTINSNL